MARSLPCTYLLPFRRAAFREEEVTKLGKYLESLTDAGCEVLLVDGSAPAVFRQNGNILRHICRHVRVDRRFGCTNDKVNGVHTGVELALSDKIILADDDIRYTATDLNQVIRLLDEFEVVRPQNFLRPLPWWAKMEAARMLINRAILRTADYPGTCAFRRRTMLAVGQYDGDVLFDNEEIIRHFAQQSCMIAFANDLFVRKRAPTFRKWIEQRPRQAYEDFGMRIKTTLFFALLPLLSFAWLLFGAPALFIFITAVSLGSILLALRGRSRGHAREFVPLHCCFFAPFWIGERTLSTWCALYWYLRRGGYPFGDRILSKGVGRAWRSGARVIRCLQPP